MKYNNGFHLFSPHKLCDVVFILFVLVFILFIVVIGLRIVRQVCCRCWQKYAMDEYIIQEYSKFSFSVWLFFRQCVWINGFPIENIALSSMVIYSVHIFTRTPPLLLPSLHRSLPFSRYSEYKRVICVFVCVCLCTTVCAYACTYALRPIFEFSILFYSVEFSSVLFVSLMNFRQCALRNLGQ